MYILNVCTVCIWLARNDFRFRSLQPGAIPGIESVKTRVKFHSTGFPNFKGLHAVVVSSLVAGGPMVSFTGDNLTFAL